MSIYPELLDIDNEKGLVTVRITPTQLSDIDTMMSRVGLRQAYAQRCRIIGITPYRYKPYRYWKPGLAKTLSDKELERLRREQTAG